MHREISREPVGRSRRPGPVGTERTRWNASDPTFGSRFECKYLIDPGIVASIREFLGPFTRPDQFAATRPNLQYPVSSLYLDSDSLGLYQQTAAGEKDRFKLRVRTYSDDPASRAFFEVKQKIDRIVHKRRAGLTRAQAASVLERGTLVAEDGLSTGVRDDLNFFLHYVHLIGARPIVRVKYQREAYEALGNEPVRVTLDSNLSHAITLNSNLSHQTGRWSATPLNGVILEIKFTERFPWWVQELVHQFGLNQRAVPKYLLSIDHMLHAGRESALSIAGITLPPQGV